LRRNTLDLDFVDKETLMKIILKIESMCQGARWGAKITDTLKGYHIEMFCLLDCDLCRMVFDDPVRYSRDLRRPVFSRDVLFNYKELVRG